MVGNGALERPSSGLRDDSGVEAVKTEMSGVEVRLDIAEHRIDHVEEGADEAKARIHGVEKETKARMDQVEEDAVFQQGLNSASTTVVVVAALIATVTFAGLIAPPGGLQSSGDEVGAAVLVHTIAFQIYYIFDAMGLFMSLAAVLSFVSWVPGRRSTSIQLWQTNMLVIWAASIFTLIAFLAAAYMVAGPSFRQLAWGVIFAGIASLGTVFCFLWTFCLYRRQKHINEVCARIRRGDPGSTRQLLEAIFKPGKLETPNRSNNEIKPLKLTCSGEAGTCGGLVR